MIEYFSLENFMSYRDKTELSFVASKKNGGTEQLPPKWYTEINGKRILKLLIGVGLNGSGKSKLILGINYLRTLATLKPEKPTDDPLYYPFKLDDVSSNRPTQMELSFYIDGKNYIYSIKVSQKRIEEEELRVTEVRSQRIFTRKHNYENNKVEIIFGASCDLSKNDQRDLEINTIANATVLAQFGAMNLESKVLRSTYEYFNKRVSKVRKGDQSLADKLKTGDSTRDGQMKRLLLKLLKDIGSNIIDYQVEIASVNVEDVIKSGVPEVLIDSLRKQYPNGVIENKSLKFKHSTTSAPAFLDSSYESFGTLNIIRLLVVIYDIVIGKKSTCIDELGEGIHSTALEFILQMYLSLAEESQIFVATHNLSLLSPRKMHLRRDAIRKFSKDKDGVTTVSRPEYIHKTISLYNKYMEELEMNIPISMVQECDFTDYHKALNPSLGKDD